MATIVETMLEQGVLEIRLNRPERFNALNPALIEEFLAAMREVNLSREVRVVIVTGEGRGFCSGADLHGDDPGAGSVPGTRGMGQLGYVYKYQEYLAELVLAISECDKPVIAAVNGAAVGGGLAIALASDIRIAVEGARFGAAFIKLGLSACDVGTSYLLPKIVGVSAASEMMLTGDNITADKALQLGLVSRVVTPEALPEEALTMARAIAANSEYGVWMTKKGLRANLDAPSLRHAIELENRTQVLGYFSGCMEEALAAFQEGRPPRWKPL